MVYASINQVMDPITKSKKHLTDVEEGYFEHGWFAIKWGIFIVGTGLASIIHGILPFLFPFTAPKNLLKLHKMMEERKEEERIRKSNLNA